MNRGLKFFVIILWSIISICSLIYHEIWRDEMRALSIIIENASIWNLIADLKNEGHPILWYLILKFGYFIYPKTIILKIISWLIGIATVILLFNSSRLPSWLLISFAFGQILLWESTIMCRNYGISSLLIVIFMVYFRALHIWGIAISLALLIQTNALSLIAAWLLFGITCYFFLVERRLKVLTAVICTTILLCSSTLLFYITTKPDNTSIIGRVNSLDIYSFIVKGGLSFFSPSQTFRALIGESAVVNILLFIGLAICLLHRKILFFSFWVLVAATNFINTEVYNLFTRHLGIVFTVFVVFLEIGDSYVKGPSDNHWLQNIQNFGKYIVVPILFIGFNVSSFLNIKKDVALPISSNKMLANFIKSNIAYKNSIIIGDADFIIEGLPYYIDNKIFKIREKQFGRYIHFTTNNENVINTSELLNYGNKFFKETNSPTLFVCNQKFNPFHDTLYKFQCYTQMKVMLYDTADLSRIYKVRDFNLSYEDENYTLYELR